MDLIASTGMGGVLRAARRGSFLVLVTGGGLSCAQVLGLDAPSVRDDGGGDIATTVTGPTPATVAGGGGAQQPAGTGGDTGSGARDATGGSGPGGAGGVLPCGEAADCDDDNPCTVGACDEGVCVSLPVPDGPLNEDPEDCRRVACVRGEVLDVAEDAEDPIDANPPCETTRCQDGAPTPVFADQGLSCGSAPQACDGAGTCVGCDPGRDVECGAVTFCSTPTCREDGVCDPGYMPVSTPLPDPLDGDCKKPQCTGDSVDATSVADDTDTAPDPPCGDAVCNGGDGSATVLPEGTACNGQAGVCSGLATTTAACRTCRDTAAGPGDAGCSGLTPFCDESQAAGEGACVECILEIHCEGAATGNDCLVDHTCGCNGAGDCVDAAWGPVCRLAAGACGCDDATQCTPSPAGDDCLPQQDRCGCDAVIDCEGSPWGAVCVASSCGCTTDVDCNGGAVCDLATNRCE